MLITAEDKTASADRFVVRSRAELLDRLSSAAADIIIMPQELSLNLADLMRDVAVHEKRMTVALKNVGAQISAGLEEASMLHAALSDDMVRTAELFAELFGQQQMELRWEVTEHQSCPKFHCDNVYIRMLVTYFGPTTEFNDQNEPGIIYRAPLNALVFLKGHKHPTYQDRILHRSPEFAAGDKRLCMIVNFSDWMPKR